MAVNCININDAKYKELLEKSGLHPVILKARISLWQDNNSVEEFPTLEEIVNTNEVNQTIKSIDILSSDKAKQVFNKGLKNKWPIDKILQELQIPKEQRQIVIDSYNNGNTNIDDLVADIASNYNYTVEVNITTQNINVGSEEVEYDSDDRFYSPSEDKYYSYNIELGWISRPREGRGQEIDVELPNDAIPEKESYSQDKYERVNSDYYSSLNVPGGTNYTENEISTPLIKPSIKGHAEFSTNNGIGWFRSDIKQDFKDENLKKVEEEIGISRNKFNYQSSEFANGIDSKTRRILELQSDLFQKGRNNNSLAENSFMDKQEAFKIHKNSVVFFKENNKYYRSESSTSLEDVNEITLEQYEQSKREADNLIYLKTGESKENNFLQILNKDNNWVNFFVKSIIQDSAKKGYEKVLFPSGDTASKIEGHQTIEDFKKEKENRINELENNSFAVGKDENYIRDNYQRINFKFRTKKEAQEFINQSELAKDNNWIIIDVSDNYRLEINQLREELERVDRDGFAALKPIYNFYENTIQNIINKQYGKENVNRITDEFGNDWFELNIQNNRDLQTIFFKEKSSLLDSLINNSQSEILITSKPSEEQSEVVEEVNYYLENSRILFNNKENNITVDEVLQNIVNSYEDLSDVGKELVNKSRNLISKSGAKIKFRNLPTDTIMGWESESNTIVLDKRSFYELTPKQIIEAFLHEVAHSTSGKAYLNPSNFEEAEFRLLVDDAFNRYKDQSNFSKSYGFSNPMEFIAELYSNREFQDEIRQISNQDGSGFWRKFIDAIRRLFGFKKNSEYTNLIDTIVSAVESDQTNYSGEIDNILFKKKVEPTVKPNLNTLEKRLQYNVNVAKDRLEQALARAKKSKKNTKTKKDNKEFIKNLEDLITKMNEYSDTEGWKSLLLYTKTLSSTVISLQKSLDKKDLKGKEVLDLINNFDNYLATYDMLDEIKKRVAESRLENLDDLTKEVVNEIRSSIEGFESKHSELVDTFKAVREEGVIKLLSNPIYSTEIETRNRKRLEKEFVDNKVIGESKQEYVSRMMNTRDKELIQSELEAFARDIVTGITPDITKTAGLLFDPLNTNSKLISVVVNIIAKTRDNILTRFNNRNFELGTLFNDFVKDKGNKKPTELYKNLYEQDKNGNYFLKGKYSIKYRDAYQSTYILLTVQKKELEDKYTEEGLSKAEYRTKEDYVKVTTKINEWLKENTITDKDDIFGKRFLPSKKWENDLTKLSDIERKVLTQFTKITEDTNKQTMNRSSLVRKISSARFYKLPSVTSSDFQRILEADIKGLTKDKLNDWTKIRVDDVGYSQEAVDGKGNTINSIKVHYRGNLPSNQQSLDLFNIYRMELLNGINFEEKSKEEVNLNTIAEVSKNKKYEKKSTRTGKALENIFSSREPIVTFEGSDSQEYKRIKGLIESNIYDVMHEHAGTLLGADVNKLTGFINSTQATVGMAINVASATANILNGFTQLAIESFGGNHISAKSLLKAEKKYTLDLPNILGDIANPVKTSFTNQMLEMFDSFGGFSPSQQEFLRNSITKKLASSHTLTGMQEGGEHMMQSILTMGVLDTLKVQNKEGQYIDIFGKHVELSKAASLLDMLKLNEKGKLYMDKNVSFTSKNLGVDYFEGGKSHINLFIKKKIHDTMGAYDSNFQNELYKTWYGKMIMMFKRYLIPGLQARWKGIGSAHISKENLSEDDLIYNSALKEYEEGIYVSLARFFTQGVIPSLKSLRLLHTTEYWNQMSDYERANLKKATLEITITAVMLPLLGMLIGAAQGDDDDEFVWFLNYQRRRLESEIAQYRNISEAWRITSNPIAGTRLLQNSTKVVGDILTPWSWLDEDSKGNNIFIKDSKKIIPIWNQLDKQWKQSYNFIDRD